MNTTATTPNPTPTTPRVTTPIQTFGLTRVRHRTILATRERFLEITKPHRAPVFIPAALASLAAGKDSWMRDIVLKCDYCDRVCKAGDMEGNGLTCPPCMMESEAEIEAENACA